VVLVHEVGSKRGAAAATAFALVGVFVLGFAAALWYRDATATLPDVALTGPLVPPEQPLPESLGDLRALDLEIAAADLQAIQRLRDRSVDRR